jgi:glutathione synthase/RimK-type ligase-like ATP-grasp enzyme
MQKEINLLALPAIQNLDEVISELSPSIKLTKGKYINLEFRFKNNQVSLIHSGIDLNTFDKVWLSSFWKSRDLAHAVGLYLNHHNIDHTYVEDTTSKITDQVLFALNNISIPDTFFIDNPEVVDYSETIADICGYPLIIKNIMGARGKYSAYVKDKTELIATLATLPKHKKYLFQEYIPNDFDWGILVSNGKVVSAEKSYHQAGEFRNHSCNGAQEIFVEIKDVPEEIIAMALNASTALNLLWSRADIVVDNSTDIPYLMEVNRCPGISSGTSEVLGARDFLEKYLNTTLQD